MSSHGPYLTTAVAIGGAVGSAYIAYRMYQKFQAQRLPTEWKQVGTLKDLYVYPIKSCGPVIIDKAECTFLGLKNGWLRDRVLMVVDKKSNFVTARQHPEMLLVHPTVRNSILTLKYEGMEPLHIDLAEVKALQPLKTASVWGLEVPVYDCGPEASKWFSSIMDGSSNNFRLAYYSSQECRGLRGNANNMFNFTDNDTSALSDETSFNLINESSVAELNTRLQNGKVTHRNFRPNFVLEGAQEYDEDNWKFVKIGENVFEIVKPCTRCVLTTIDPETGVKNVDSEPLNTLKSYRQVTDPKFRKTAGTSPRMGVQMALRSGPGGIVSVNHPVYAA